MLTVNPNDNVYKLQEKIGLGGFWRDVNKVYTDIKEFENAIRKEYEDKLHRRNVQIADLKHQVENPIINVLTLEKILSEKISDEDKIKVIKGYIATMLRK